MIVVADSSPLIAFSRIDKIKLLQELFGEILIPDAVYDELTTGGHEFNHKWIKRKRVTDTNLVKILSSKLDRGESEAIALAMELGAEILIMDEKPGRRIAQHAGLNVTGTAAILVRLARSGKIDIKKELDNLIKNDFRLSNGLYQRCIEQSKKSKTD